MKLTADQVFSNHASKEARESFANAVLNGEKDRLAEQPSKSSSHRLAQQQALGRLAEIVFHYREFLELWGKPCQMLNIDIGIELMDETGKIVNHGITTKPLIASLGPASQDIADHIEGLVQKAARNCAWSLACLSKEIADIHAYMEQELLKPQAEDMNQEKQDFPDQGLAS